jgi:cysteine desulfurase
MAAEGAEEARRIRGLRDRLKQQLFDALEEIRLNGAEEPRHPGNLNVSFGYVDGAALLLELCKVASVSSGAACSAAEAGPSYVLEAMGVEKDWAAASVRFGVGRHTTNEEIDRVAARAVEVVRTLREHSPLWKAKATGQSIDW